MTGKLFIKELEIVCIIGTHPHEREQPQPILLDLDIDYDIQAAAESDSLDEAVDYEPLALELSKFIQEKKFYLIEKLAVESCQAILAQDQRIDRVTLSVRKQRVIPNARYSGIQYSLERR